MVNAGTAAEPFTVNSYLVCQPASHGAVLIDPGADDERFAAVAAELGVRILMVLNTHGHFDHSAADAACRERFAAKLAAPEADRPLYEKSGDAAIVDLWLRDGQTLDCGGLAIRVLATPSHSPGSVCFLIGGQSSAATPCSPAASAAYPRERTRKKR